MMDCCVVGINPAWQFRKTKASYFQVKLEDEEEWEDERPSMLLLSQTKAAFLSSQLQHGDVVDFGFAFFVSFLSLF